MYYSEIVLVYNNNYTLFYMFACVHNFIPRLHSFYHVAPGYSVKPLLMQLQLALTLLSVNQLLQ